MRTPTRSRTNAVTATAITLVAAMMTIRPAAGADNATEPDAQPAESRQVAGAAASMSAARQGDAVVVKSGNAELLRYHLKKPADVKLPVDSGGYFHPLTTPAGVVVTDVAPADHPHHRGVFLAWVEMHGKKDADFWGWGEHAPIKDRRIVGRGARAKTEAGSRKTTMTAHNDWRAEGETIIREELLAAVSTDGPAKATVLDLIYILTPTADLTLSRWAFSGFCVRTRGDGKLTAHSPAGEVKL